MHATTGVHRAGQIGAALGVQEHSRVTPRLARIIRTSHILERTAPNLSATVVSAGAVVHPASVALVNAPRSCVRSRKFTTHPVVAIAGRGS